MKLQAQVIPSGNATAVEIPEAALVSLGGGARPAVSVTINGHTWRTRVARMRGMCLIGISTRNRAGARIAEGDHVELDIALDELPREVPEPPDLKRELDADPSARSAFEKLPFGLRLKHVRQLEEAKSAETRDRRLAKLLSELQASAA
ncbi:YdeI/OmpD-associated family protein [Jeongeupia naejangsanensis]|uniref:DUF1905 domain-containing protein n=1 Tax=Jeongeupia naejangsanensis TaxID=613195 RepID=A0ABS2BQG4_9NEIS|nr:YdeI/OmpD-associated family protein [Jeongeupia naejangsanensis]MBM3117866.1 DUF1905 domain-containing protein [Jeongeupia naejangsanensis]